MREENVLLCRFFFTMSSMSARLLAGLSVHTTNQRKRARELDLSLSGEGGGGRTNKQPRIDTGTPAAARLPYPDQHHQQQEREEDEEDQMTADDEAGDPTSRLYTPLHVEADRIYKQTVDRMLRGPRRHMNCFLCNFAPRYEKEKKRFGGQGLVVLDDATYAYNLLVEFYKQNPNMPEGQVATELCRIYRTQVYDPVMRRGGGRPRHDLPAPSVETFLDHMLLYNFDMFAKQKRLMQGMEDFLLICRDKLLVGTSRNLDPVASRYFMAAHQNLWNITVDFQRRVAAAGGDGNNPFQLDPRKIIEFAGSGPLEQLVQRASGVLGGATATDTDAALNMATARRPVMGEVSVDEEPVEEDPMNLDEPRDEEEEDDDEDT